MGRRIPCEVRSTDVEGVPGVEVTCTDCGNVTTSKGETDRSVRRCLALMREECPEGEDNYYVDADE
jgi:hypothetical protein